jgi:hypothetical protein
VGIELITLLKPCKLLIPRSGRSHKFPKLAQPRYTAGTRLQICGSFQDMSCLIRIKLMSGKSDRELTARTHPH